ncbi:hypothetical protein [Paenibacillus pabuli]
MGVIPRLVFVMPVLVLPWFLVRGLRQASIRTAGRYFAAYTPLASRYI